MALRILAVTFDSRHPVRQARFWASMLGREVVEAAGGVLLPGDSSQLGLRFVAESAARKGPNLAHLHLTSASIVDQQNTVARAVDLGARHVDLGQSPDEGHVVLADPEGSEFCVIEPGNNFLAGCGFLGEVTCDGPRVVGLFWSRAVDWPLVWDQDEETAIQSPDGGTKISWGGDPVTPPEARRRHRFHLVAAGEPETEIDRLVALGATRLEERDVGSAVLADPGGNEFEVVRQ